MLNEEKRQSVIKQLKGDITFIEKSIAELNHEKKKHVTNLKALRQSLKELSEVVFRG
jgi:chaperonin cofactor prefoldin